jgi:23S rRNA pseudouridine2457 synthase
MLYYFTIYKPFRVLTQFSAQPGKETLADHFNVPADVYPVGRLDYDSEGLLVLTNDKTLNQRLLHPRFAHERAYYVQVEGAITQEAIDTLCKGVTIQADGKTFRTRPCKARIFKTAPPVAPRIPPIRVRKHIPDSWIELVLTEGKNRQVRKMTAAVGFPTLRLLRYRIAGVSLEGMQPGDLCEWKGQELLSLLFPKPFDEIKR